MVKLRTKGRNSLMIFCSAPVEQYKSKKVSINAAIQRMLDSGQYVLGAGVSGFEQEFASYIGLAHCIGVNSGTDALHIALLSLGVGHGDEVITVSHTAIATAAAIKMTGATPVFCDIDPDCFTLNADLLPQLITPRTKAIIVVHLYGQAADMDPVMRIAKTHGLKVIEDCAQAVGATYKDIRVGAIGDIGCFSFYPTKNLGAIGDAGAIVTNSSEHNDKIRRIREYGWQENRLSIEFGLNSRMDEIQATVLRVKLPFLDEDNSKRKVIADKYDLAFVDTEIGTPKRHENGNHVYHLYVIRCADKSKRDFIMDAMRAKDIACAIHYDPPVHLHPSYVCEGQRLQDLSVSEHAASTVLSLPIYPELTNENLNLIISTLQDILSTFRASIE